MPQGAGVLQMASAASVWLSAAAWASDSCSSEVPVGREQLLRQALPLPRTAVVTLLCSSDWSELGLMLGTHGEGSVRRCVHVCCVVFRCWLILNRTCLGPGEWPAGRGSDSLLQRLLTNCMRMGTALTAWEALRGVMWVARAHEDQGKVWRKQLVYHKDRSRGPQ